MVSLGTRWDPFRSILHHWGRRWEKHVHQPMIFSGLPSFSPGPISSHKTSAWDTFGPPVCEVKVRLLPHDIESSKLFVQHHLQYSSSKMRKFMNWTCNYIHATSMQLNNCKKCHIHPHTSKIFKCFMAWRWLVRHGAARASVSKIIYIGPWLVIHHRSYIRRGQNQFELPSNRHIENWGVFFRGPYRVQSCFCNASPPSSLRHVATMCGTSPSRPTRCGKLTVPLHAFSYNAPVSTNRLSWSYR